MTSVTDDDIERLKIATQLLPGSQIQWKGGIEDAHQVVFNIKSDGVSILGIEIWNEAAQDVRFVPWHAVELVIPPGPESA